MHQVSHRFNHAASHHLARVAAYINQAGRHLSDASRSAPDRYHERRLRRLLADLRTLSEPLAGLASSLERGGGQ